MRRMGKNVYMLILCLCILSQSLIAVAEKKPETGKLTDLKTELAKNISTYPGTWSVFVENLDTGEYFTINNTPIYAASLIKLYAMGACYEKIAQGEMKESEVSGLLNSMITVSSNDAFNSIVKKVGIKYTSSWCKKNGFQDTKQERGLSPSGNNYGIAYGAKTNRTSVLDCGKFLESVYNGTCVNKQYSKKMLNLLKKQTRTWKIPAGVPKGVVIANKTGETNATTHDAAIVYSKGAPYILCVMLEVKNAWGNAYRITNISQTVYGFFN